MPRKFQEDLDYLLEKLSRDAGANVRRKMRRLRDKLVHLYLRNLVKINHSVLELVCGKYLISAGYEVDVERFLDGVSCDIYALKGFGSLIVEVETGFVPPEHALDPLTYCKARIASKITRYSGHANKFSLGGPPHYIMQIPEALIKPPRSRTSTEIDEVKRLCDLYYTNPPVSVQEIEHARLHTVYIIHVDEARTEEHNPAEYTKRQRITPESL